MLSNCAFSQQASAPTVESIKLRLTELNAIKQQGLITDDEYNKKNLRLKSLLNSVSQPDSPAPESDDQSISSEQHDELNPANLQPPTHPVNPKAAEWNDKSLASANRGDWADAIRTASVAIALDPDFALAYVNRCRAYIGHNDLDEATQDCDNALKIEPNNPLAINNLGVIMDQQGKIDTALTAYEQACLGGLDLGCRNFHKIQGYSPKDPVTLIAKVKLDEAKAKFSNKDWDGAITWASEAINLWADYAAAYVTRSGAYANKGSLPEALNDAETVIRINPDEGLGYNNRGYTYELMKKPRQAKLDYEIACGLKAQIGCINLKRIKHID